MLETIREFAEEQLVAGGTAEQVWAAHARYFAEREDDILALWDSPRQREAYTWLTVELANLRTAFRWTTDHGDLDGAASIATYAGLVGFLADVYEPIAWAGELVEPARAQDHPRLAFLYVIASMCWVVGRIEAAVGYSDAGQTVVAKDCAGVPFGIHGWLGGAYSYTGRPDRLVEWCRAELTRGRDTLAVTRSCMTFALASALESPDEAIAAATGLIEAAEGSGNPYAIAFALSAYGLAFRDADPDRARKELRRGLAIAHDSGIRTIETTLATILAVLEVNSGDSLAALEYFAGAIRGYHDANNTANMRSALDYLALRFDRLGRVESAAILVGRNPLTAAWFPRSA